MSYRKIGMMPQRRGQPFSANDSSRSTWILDVLVAG